MRQDLVTVFRVGWTVLYQQVVVHVARRLIDVLSGLSSISDLHDDLRALCLRLHKHLREGTPWQARGQLDVIAILDFRPRGRLPLCLIDECPVITGEVEPSKRPLPGSEYRQTSPSSLKTARLHRFANSSPRFLRD